MKKCFIAAFFLVVGMVAYGQPSSEDGFNLPEGNARDWTDISSYRRSLEILNDRIGRNPNDGEAYIHRGNTYFQLGDFECAFADYDKAIELDPTELAYENRGNAYFRRGDYDKSIADYTYAVTLASSDNKRAGNFYALALVYAAKGDQEQAEKNLNEAKGLGYYRASIGLPVYTANFTVDANLYSLDLVVDKSPDDQVHIIKNFDEAYFNYNETINENTIRLVSTAQLGINSDIQGGITYTKDRRNRVVLDDKARVIVQAPDGVAIKFVSVNGGVTVNDIDCALIDVKTSNGNLALNKSNWDSIQLDMINGSIYYTGGIEGKSIGFETMNGNISIELEAGSDVDVDIQSNYSYKQHLSGGVEKTGYSTGRITNQRGSGLINAVTRNGNIDCKVLY